MTAREEELVTASGTGDEVLDVGVVGGSQAGLAMAWHLARQNLRFVVLDAGPELGDTWRSRWDSLTLFTPTQHDALPGMPFPCSPDTYPGKDAVAGYLTAYAAEFNLPVRLNARVTDLRQTAEGFEIRAQDEVFRARQVVVATGPFQRAGAYQRHYGTEVREHLRAVSGFRGAQFLRREEDGEVAFTSVAWFTDLDAVRGFAGSDYGRAVVEEAARMALSRWDERVVHHEVAVHVS